MRDLFPVVAALGAGFASASGLDVRPLSPFDRLRAHIRFEQDKREFPVVVEDAKGEPRIRHVERMARNVGTAPRHRVLHVHGAGFQVAPPYLSWRVVLGLHRV